MHSIDNDDYGKLDNNWTTDRVLSLRVEGWYNCGAGGLCQKGGRFAVMSSLTGGNVFQVG